MQLNYGRGQNMALLMLSVKIILFHSTASMLNVIPKHAIDVFSMLPLKLH